MKSIVPPSLGEIIATADGFSDQTYDLLEQLIRQPASTDPDEAELDRISKAAGVQASDLRYFLSFLSFLFAQTEDTGAEEVEASLNEFLAEHSKEIAVERLSRKLTGLLAHRDVLHAAAKRRRLRDGFLPNLLDVAHFVDLRSDFERNSKGELTGNIVDRIPVIQLALRTSSTRDFESELILQLDADAVEQFQAAQAT